MATYKLTKIAAVELNDSSAEEMITMYNYGVAFDGIDENNHTITYKCTLYKTDPATSEHKTITDEDLILFTKFRASSTTLSKRIAEIKNEFLNNFDWLIKCNSLEYHEIRLILNGCPCISKSVNIWNVVGKDKWNDIVKPLHTVLSENHFKFLYQYDFIKTAYENGKKRLEKTPKKSPEYTKYKEDFDKVKKAYVQAENTYCKINQNKNKAITDFIDKIKKSLPFCTVTNFKQSKLKKAIDSCLLTMKKDGKTKAVVFSYDTAKVNKMLSLYIIGIINGDI